MHAAFVRAAGAIGLSALATLHAVAAPPPEPGWFSGIGILPGQDSSGAWSMSRDGSVIAGSSGSGPLAEGVRWTRTGGLLSIGRLGDEGGGTNAHDVSADGSVIVGLSNQRAFRWTAQTGMVDLGTLRDDDLGFASAWGVSDDGQTVIGTAQAKVGFDVFRWKPGSGMTNLGFFDGAGISGDASAFICTQADSGAFSGLLVRDGQEPIPLDGLPGSGLATQPKAVNTDGTRVVGFIGSDFNAMTAFVWTDATQMVALPDLPGGLVTARALGLSDDGSVIVGESGSGAGRTATVWLDGQPRSVASYLFDNGISFPGWFLTSANAVSADGSVIAGIGVNRHGNVEGWVARIPTPGVVPVLLLSTAAISQRRRQTMVQTILEYQN